jgi:hypothetical protein
MPRNRRCRLLAMLIALFTLMIGAGLPAANAASENGFSTIIRPSLTGEEIGAQDALWTLDVSVKPMRMVFVQITNPRTGEKSSELVWYLVYKIVNRPAPKRPGGTDTVPVNVEDPPPAPVFVPRATLVTEDHDIHKVIVDSIVPEALAAINAREHLDLKTSVQIAGALPKVTPAGSKEENAVYGVFMFRGVDPRTTAFSVYLSGFSSLYKIGKDASGNPLHLRRTIQIPFRRPADEFDQYEKEIRQQGDPKWVYVPDEVAAATK